MILLAILILGGLTFMAVHWQRGFKRKFETMPVRTIDAAVTVTPTPTPSPTSYNYVPILTGGL